MNRTKENASRLANALFNHADESVIKVLAHYLVYEEEQLLKDINDLYKFVSLAKKKACEDE